jgi:general secretion pathway protein I
LLRRRRASSSGFGLLEAIVALTLLAGTGMALFSWINQNLQSASRLRLHEQESRLLLSAQSLVDTVNPLQTPTGRLEVGGLAVRWEAEALEPARQNATFTEGLGGPWLVGLYRLRVHAQDSVQGVELRFEQWRVGTRRLQPASEVLR